MLIGRPIGFFPEGVDDPNWELNAYVEEVKGDLELQELLPVHARLPKESVDALRASLEKASAELAELDAKFLATLK